MGVKEANRRKRGKGKYVQRPGAGDTRSRNWDNLSGRNVILFILMLYYRCLLNMQVELSSKQIDRSGN